jgi:hypothetical protein
MLADLEQGQRTAYVDAYHVALLLDALGRREEAFQELERAFEEDAFCLLFMDADAKAEAIRTDPRFAGFRRTTLRGRQIPPAHRAFAPARRN